MPWTEERVERLKKFLDDGLTASQIAKELGDVTRNAVIGKIHRLGLANRPDEPDDMSKTPQEGAEASDGGSGEGSNNGSAAPANEGSAPADQPPPPPPQLSASEIRARALENIREVEMRARKLDLLELTERTCKWPIGDPATDDFWFCGLAAKPGKPYCEAHAAVAFQPPNSRRDRRR